MNEMLNEMLIAQLVDCFYAKVRQDEMLAPIFENAIAGQWDSHLATMRAFWCSIMLGSAAYKGNPLAVHSRLPSLNARHFERWLSLWRETAFEVCGRQGALFVQRAEAIAVRLLGALSSGSDQLAKYSA